MVLRFANAIFEPLWNHALHRSCADYRGGDAGRRGRAAGYYERAGALRDMVQNHLLQLLCLVAMEPPTDLSADSIRDEKVKVVRSFRRMTRTRKWRRMSSAGNTRRARSTANLCRLIAREERVAGFDDRTFVALQACGR